MKNTLIALSFILSMGMISVFMNNQEAGKVSTHAPKTYSIGFKELQEYHSRLKNKPYISGNSQMWVPCNQMDNPQWYKDRGMGLNLKK